MATGAPDRETYISHINVSSFPDLSSNFLFLNSFETANRIAEQANEELEKLGYLVKLDQHLTGAGGIGILPNLVELIQQLWDKKELIAIPFSIMRFIYSHFKNKDAKLPAQSRRLAIVTVLLCVHSKTLIAHKGVYIGKESTMNTLMECATVLAPKLQKQYPQIAFRFELDFKLDVHKTQLNFTVEAAELGYHRFPSLFRLVALRSNNVTRISVINRFLIKREDLDVDPESSSLVWTYKGKTKIYYYLLPGRIISRDFMPLLTPDNTK